MMKPVLKWIFTALLIAALSTTAYAACPFDGPRCDGNCDAPDKYLCFVDADGDGICDNRDNGGCFLDADGDGLCDSRSKGLCFVDEDGDGLCDNQGKGGCFADADGDGVCDNYGQNAGRGRCHQRFGRGHGCHGRRG